MSNEILNQCWKLPVPQAAKFVLISLADQANDDGICWPSVSFICERTSLCDRAVQKSLKWLSEHMAIRIEANAASKGRNRYTVTPETFTPELGSPPNHIHPEPSSPTPERGSPQPPKVVREPPNEVRTNHKEPSVNPQEPKSKKPTREKIGLDIFDLVADGLDENVAKSWIAVRKSKNAKLLTDIAWGKVKTEAAKAGITQNDAVRIAVEKNWTGFGADWNWGKNANAPPGKPSKTMHTGFDNHDYSKDEAAWNS